METIADECFICTKHIIYGVKSTKCTENHTICISCFKEYHKYKCIFCRQRMRTVQVIRDGKVIAVTPTQNLINTECLYTMKQKGQKGYILDYSPIFYNFVYIFVLLCCILFMNMLIMIGFRTPRFIINCNDIIENECVYTDIYIILIMYRMITTFMMISLNAMFVEKILNIGEYYKQLTPYQMKNTWLKLSSG
jgi:hypothetical protein